MRSTRAITVILFLLFLLSIVVAPVFSVSVDQSSLSSLSTLSVQSADEIGTNCSTGTQTSNASANTLSFHWVPGCGYRDELNRTDEDYYNFWTDNAGKILSMAVTTGDATDASHALTFLQSRGLGSPSSSSSSYYLPEVLVNSSIVQSQNNATITNRIVELVGNTASSGLQGLAIGNYYAGSTTMGYLGSDRILVSGKTYRSNSSTVLPISGGYSKRSLFETSNGDYFYLYLNATLAAGEPYAEVSIQLLPLNSSLSSSDLLYLQVFSSSGQFDNASLYGHDGSFLRQLAYNSVSLPCHLPVRCLTSLSPSVFPSAHKGLIIPYSEQFNVLGEDSVAVSFDNSTASVAGFEHLYYDGAFDGLSWIGIAYNAPANSVGVLSEPIYSNVYPLEHLDYHLVNDTARFIASNPVNVAVSPPAGFGFVSYGLALDAASNPQNTTLTNLARGYWGFYLARYSSSSYRTPYALSIYTFTLAGFKLYGCNSTVENFARRFMGNTSGSSIEEYGYAAAALYQLYECTGLHGDEVMYQHFVDAFVPSSSTFLTITPDLPSEDYLFQLGEAASGLLLGGLQFNSPIVLDAMNAVYQSNVNGTMLNQPYHGDLANTEGLPAYTLSTFLFQREMKNVTGYWISSLRDCNLTSLLYSNGSLIIGANGNPGGSVTLSGHNGLTTYSVDKLGSVVLVAVHTSTFTSTTTAVSTIASVVVSTTTTTTSTIGGGASIITLAETLAAGVVLGLAASTAYSVRRRKRYTQLQH